MAAPNLSFNILSTALGSAKPSPAKRILVIGPSTIGTANVAKKHVNIKALRDEFGYGRMPEAAAMILDAGGEVVVVKATANLASTSFSPSVPLPADAVHTFTGTGTSVIDATGTAVDDFDFVFTVVTGGTIAAAGIKFTVSCDGGLTNGGVIALGTANTYLIPNTGVTLTFAAGTLVAGDTDSFSVRSSAMTADDFHDAMVAFFESNHTAGTVLFTEPLTAAIAEATTPDSEGPKTILDTWATQNRFMCALSTFRAPSIGESLATWYGLWEDEFLNKDWSRFLVGGSWGRIPSKLSGRRLLRPVSWAVAMRAASTAISESAGYVARGATGFTIADANGALYSNAYDERVHRTLDAERACTFTSILGFPGVYVTRPLMLAAPGSDFTELPNRRVMDEACRIATEVLTLRINSSVRIDKTTGFIFENDAAEIESAVNTALARGLVAPGDASDAKCILSRTDDILATKTVSVEIRILPKGYLEYIAVTIGYTNPAQAIAEAAATATP